MSESINSAETMAGLLGALDKAQGVIRFDAEGNILTANANFLAVTGYRMEELKGKHHRIFVSPELAASDKYAAFWAKLRSGAMHQDRFERIGKGGRSFWIDGSYVPIQDASGAVVGVVKFAMDVTDRVGSIQKLSDLLRAMGGGDLTARVGDTLFGEFEEIRQALHGCMDNLEGLLSNTIGTVDLLSRETSESAERAQDMTMRAAEQAKSVELALEKMTEIDKMVHATAASAEQAQGLASTAVSRAQSGEEIVSSAVQAMEGIEGGTKSITDMIAIIEGIAFQTNILALNASVEAARAGDAGRGFAVVAAEVRLLSQRTSDAARQIADVVTSSSKQVSEGSKLVTQTGGALEEIAKAVIDVVARMDVIADDSKSQIEHVKSVHRSTEDIGATVRNTVNFSEQSAKTAQILSQSASQLSARLETFKVGPAAPQPESLVAG